MFEDLANYDPSYHARVPLKRDPLNLALRGGWIVLSLLFSRHPTDVVLWLRSLALNRTKPLTFPIPWLTFDAIREVRGFLRPGMKIFEFGSGHSTIWFARAGAEVYSVEDDHHWYTAVERKLREDRLDRAHLYYADNETDYVGAIDRSGEHAFDILFFDGSYRLQCLQEALPYLKPGGILVFDDSDFNWFDGKDFGVPSDWEKKVFRGWEPLSGGRSETIIWRKPGTLSVDQAEKSG
jgi:SAM-dependent methyltransferase